MSLSVLGAGRAQTEKIRVIDIFICFDRTMDIVTIFGEAFWKHFDGFGKIRTYEVCTIQQDVQIDANHSLDCL